MGAQKDGVCISKSDFLYLFTELRGQAEHGQWQEFSLFFIDIDPEGLQAFLNLGSPKHF